MKLLPWILVSLLGAFLLILAGKVYTLRKSARQLREGMAQQLERETNTLLAVSSGDREMRALADALNGQLAQLRAERQRYQHGDLELKEAITNISHDLRTPLTAIVGYLALLEGEEKSEAVERYLSQISNRTQVLHQLSEELFAYALLTAPQPLTPSGWTCEAWWRRRCCLTAEPWSSEAWSPPFSCRRGGWSGIWTPRRRGGC